MECGEIINNRIAWNMAQLWNIGDYPPDVVHVHKHVCITDMTLWDTITKLSNHCSTLGVFNNRA